MTTFFYTANGEKKTIEHYINPTGLDRDDNPRDTIGRVGNISDLVIRPTEKKMCDAIYTGHGDDYLYIFRIYYF